MFLAVSLNQEDGHAAFLSRTLNLSERNGNNSSMEKEANVNMEANSQRSHYLKGKHFILTTDHKLYPTFSISIKLHRLEIHPWRIEFFT